ncbi:MAG: hypothetical protein FJW64_04050 [Actinobacteria bacterium]|nr:hypothetical protein [Actinomycetota bacterium]
MTIHLDGHTFLAIEAAARRASDVAGRKVEMRELIERRLTDAVTGVAVPGRPNRPRSRYTPEQRALMTNGRPGKGNRLTAEGHRAIREMTAANLTRAAIAAEIGCHPKAIAYYHRKLRQEQQNQEKTA